tara:strand:+ start:545 stop:1039 length:495 start_codon:yes stop_codon:yes gene_type:complete
MSLVDDNKESVSDADYYKMCSALSSLFKSPNIHIGSRSRFLDNRFNIAHIQEKKRIKLNHRCNDIKVAMDNLSVSKITSQLKFDILLQTFQEKISLLSFSMPFINGQRVHTISEKVRFIEKYLIEHHGYTPSYFKSLYDSHVQQEYQQKLQSLQQNYEEILSMY